jgi:hypothetical protein
MLNEMAMLRPSMGNTKAKRIREALIDRLTSNSWSKIEYDD